MQLLGSDVQAMFLKPLLDDSYDALGKEPVDSLLRELGIESAQLFDPGTWLTLEGGEAIIDRIVALRNDPGLFERCGKLAFDPKYVGMMGPILRAFGTPASAYEQLNASLPRFNKVGAMKVERRGRGRIDIEYRALEGKPREHSPHSCAMRRENLAGMTTMFKLPPATVLHPKCMTRGDSFCLYQVQWREPVAQLPSLVGSAAGAMLGAVFAYAADCGFAWAIAALVLFSLSGWLVGRVLELRKQLNDRKADILEHNGALAASVETNERRFVELVEAKAEVEKKVEARTHELSETSARLATTLDEVQALDRAKTDFFSNVSHELRTPLTLLIGPLDDLIDGREPPGGTKAAVEVMHRNALRLLRLINQLLDLAKIDAGDSKLSRIQVDSSSLARTVVEPFASAARARNINLTVDAPHVVPLFVDLSWMESALSNLVANAMRFVPDGGTITLRVVDRGHDVVFQVKDNGAGILSKDIPTLFERFAQGSDMKSRSGGTGLGLAIVQEAARLHGGETSVESAVGVGSTFSVRIPRVAADMESTESVEESGNHAQVQRLRRPSAAIESTAPRSNTAVDRLRPGAPLVLVVDDNEDIRTFVTDVLSAQYSVITAVNGRDGVELAARRKPDAVVSDIAMPEMDGLSLARALRANSTTRGIPLILLTARRDVNHVLEGFDAGADDYITKPFHGRELLARLDVRIRLNRLAQEMAHRERLAQLGVLAASVAHQVRNPLTSIRAGLPAVKSKLGAKLDSRSLEMFDVMIDSADRIELLTADLVNLSGGDRTSTNRCKPGEGLLASVRLISTRAPDNVKILTAVDTTVEIEGRAGDLNQVFLNLLDNAARAVGSAGIIDVRAQRDGNTYTVSVGDSGKGVDTAIEARIFDPFFTTRDAGEGTGLGLSIAKQIVDMHGGTITIGRSDYGGALFKVSLPIGPNANLFGEVNETTKTKDAANVTLS
ncbi:MAG: response regulator [Sandaracinaceae bacterium]|nr:response regulator [Sandaracinaceae bacterium]